MRDFAAYLLVLGAAGTVSMLIYRAAALYTDLEQCPAWALTRVRWWARHAVAMLRLSVGLLACGGVLLLVS